MSKWTGLDRGPITAAIAEAERDRLFDRPARRASRELTRLLANSEMISELASRRIFNLRNEPAGSEERIAV